MGLIVGLKNLAYEISWEHNARKLEKHAENLQDRLSYPHRKRKVDGTEAVEEAKRQCMFEKWDEILTIVRTECDLSDASYNDWLKPLKFYGISGCIVMVAAPFSQEDIGYLKRYYSAPLQSAIREISGIDSPRVDFVSPEDIDKKEKADRIMDFSIELLQACYDEAETLDKTFNISPFAALCALGMMANGAAGDTKAEIEEVLKMPMEVLDQYIRVYMEEDDYGLKGANLICFSGRENPEIWERFVRLCNENYGADIVEEELNPVTVGKINDWVEQKTDGMIGSILEPAGSEGVLHLINALAFDKKWDICFQEESETGDFINWRGTVQKVKMMSARENIYLEDAHTVGFMKPYEDERFCFVALLPKEDEDIIDYLFDLTGKKLRKILLNAQIKPVVVKMPAFKGETEIKMKEALKAMGIGKVFSEEADFSKLGALENVAVKDVKQKTYISVDKEGAKAAAATMTEYLMKSITVPGRIVLDRPFIYMIYDEKKELPIFIGIMMEV